MSDVLDSPGTGRRVVRGSAARGLGFVATTLLGLLSVVLLTRHVGVGGYGRYQTVISLMMVVQVVTDAGLTAFATREYAQLGPDERVALVRVLLALRVTVTVSGVIVAAGVTALLGAPAVMVGGVLLTGAGLVLSLLYVTVQLPLLNDLRLGLVAWVDVVRQAGTTALVCALVLADASLGWFFAVTIPVHLALLAWMVVLVRGTVPLRPSFAGARAVLAPAVGVSVAVSLGVVYLYASQLLVSVSTGDHTTGVFSVAFRAFVLAASVPGVMVTGAFPVLSRLAADRPRLRDAMDQLLAGTLLLGGAAVVVCVLGAEPIVRVLGGEEFTDAAPVLRVMGAVLLLTFALPVLGFTLLARHRQSAQAVVNGLGLAVVCVAVPLLVRGHGPQGAAVGMLLGEATLVGGYLVLLSRDGLTPAALPVVRVVALTAVALVPALLGLPDVVAAVAGVALYAAGAILAGAVPAAVVAAVRR